MQTNVFSKPNKILVVLSPDLVEPANPNQSPLLTRAVELAQLFGAELELFHVCHDTSLDWSFLSRDVAVQRSKEKVLQHNATLVSEIAALMPTLGIKVKTDVQWGSPRIDVIHRKIIESEADLVLKQAREHTYVLGLNNTVDWSLIRDTQVPVWFVKESEPSDSSQKGVHKPIERVVSAIGTNVDSEDIFGAIDYEIVRAAKDLADLTAGEHTLIHTYIAPRGVSIYADYEPILENNPKAVANMSEGSRDLAISHGESIRAFAELHQVDSEAIILAEGHPKNTLPSISSGVNASLLVMGVQDRDVWSRLWQPVAAEPVLADVPCDVLFLKEGSMTSEAVVESVDVVHGEPKFDLERAIVCPQEVFRSPFEIVEATELALSLKYRLLQSWEFDLNALMQDVNEGGEQRESTSASLAEIRRAVEALEKTNQSTAALS